MCVCVCVCVCVSSCTVGIHVLCLEKIWQCNLPRVRVGAPSLLAVRVILNEWLTSALRQLFSGQDAYSCIFMLFFFINVNT